MPYADPVKQKQAQHESYLRNKFAVMSRMQQRRVAIKAWLRDLKSKGKCADCGKNPHPAAMDFHHRDPSTKEFEVGRGAHTSMNKERVKKEIAKCDLLCANCHRIRHARVAQSARAVNR